MCSKQTSLNDDHSQQQKCLELRVCLHRRRLSHVFESSISAHLTEQNSYFNQSSGLHRPQNAWRLSHTTHDAKLLVCFLPFYSRNYSNYVLGSERCQNKDDQHSVLCLNTSCVDTGFGQSLLKAFIVLNSVVHTISERELERGVHTPAHLTSHCVKWAC